MGIVSAKVRSQNHGSNLTVQRDALTIPLYIIHYTRTASKWDSLVFHCFPRCLDNPNQSMVEPINNKKRKLEPNCHAPLTKQESFSEVLQQLEAEEDAAGGKDIVIGWNACISET